MKKDLRVFKEAREIGEPDLARRQQRRERPDPYCPHCGEPGHTVICDDCYRELGAGA
jgi:hypothetical protein